MAPPESSERYFPGGFSAKRVAERLREDAHFACGGGDLYAYRNGCYRPNASSAVQTRTTDLLGDRWSRRRADEVVAFLRATSPELWDTPPVDTVNARNGLVDVSSGRLLPHTPDFLTSVQIGAAFDPRASCPRIDAFANDVFPADARELAYELPGYLMAPDPSEETAWMLIGTGGNGKSTYLNVLIAFLGGSANVSAATLQSLDSNRFSAASLYGKLANIVADLDAEAVKSSAVFKAIVSGDPIQAERKYGTPFVFRPFARLLFSANEAPPTHDTTYAYFRRWMILPFDVVFTGPRRDKTLARKLTTQGELSGLLNRALEGLASLRARGGFAEPASVVAAKHEFRVAVDSTAAFVAEQCVLGPDLRVAKPELYQAYKDWCGRVNRSPLSARRFNERIEPMLQNSERPVVTVSGTDYWNGITLLSYAPEAPPEPPDTEFEGGERVEKVAELSTPLSPEGEGKQERVSRTATFPTQPPPDTVAPTSACDHWPSVGDAGEADGCRCCGRPKGSDGDLCLVCRDGRPHQVNAAIRMVAAPGARELEGGLVRDGTASAGRCTSAGIGRQPHCLGCGRQMSVVCVGDLCGRCKAWGVVPAWAEIVARTTRA